MAVTSSQAQALIDWLRTSYIPKDVPYQTALDAIAELERIAQGKEDPKAKARTTKTQER